MDVTGVALAVVVGIVAAALLFWHVQQVKKRPAMGHDKLMGAVWAALIVLALARVVCLVAGGGETKLVTPVPAPTPATAPK